MKSFVTPTIAVIGALVFMATSASAQVFVEDFEGGSLAGWELNKSAIIVEDPLVPGNSVVTFTDANNTYDLRSFELPLLPGVEYRLSFRYLGLPNAGSAPDNLGGIVGVGTLIYGNTEDFVWDTTDCPTAYLGDLIDDGAWHEYELVITREMFTADPGTPIYVMLEDWDGAASACPPNATVGDVFFDDFMVEQYGPVPVEPDSWSALKARY